ncbi:glycoside hydrolase family 3 protein [Flexithrix dorotheae]|uniref:glycoside hydrolase family 3 protein n=1 Tax=Flexithrix dorotheae TaxID=70993 RepID=UPI00036812C5|nr:glycoside hydrolase family 3 N-terminal domain-containing protein [Flexithrix dorotheae]
MRPAFLDYLEHSWVLKTLQKLSPEERIAQLIHVAGYSNRDENHEKDLLQLVEKLGIGGIIFFQGTPEKQAQMVNHFQEKAKVPLMISIDGEWGLAMRLNNSTAFPYQMALGALEENHLIYEMGREIGKHCKRAGIQVNFAPVADINNNPDNPVISFRSFGENREMVAEKAAEYMKGLQDEGVLACAKHFPGHGDTSTDSHFGLPVISHSKERFEDNELYPFSKLIEVGIASMMIAHLNVPAIDPAPNMPSTLSKPIITDLLKGDLGFEGLTFTDALDMKGVADLFPSGVVDAKALVAGNDVLLFTVDPEKAITEIKKAIENGEITQEAIDWRCQKLLAAKKWAGLDKFQPIETERIQSELNNNFSKNLNQKLAEKSITLLRNEGAILPLKPEEKVLVISLMAKDVVPVFHKPELAKQLQHHFKSKEENDDKQEALVFQKAISKKFEADQLLLDNELNGKSLEELKAQISSYDKVILGIHKLAMKPREDFGISEQMKALVNYVSGLENSIISVFGNAYALSKFEKIQETKGLILTYQESEFTQKSASKLILGKITAEGKLPVTVNEHFQYGAGIV